MSNLLNLFNHTENVKRIVHNGPFLPPIMCDVDLSSACNLNCEWCCQANWRFAKNRRLMPDHVVEKLPRFASEWGVKSFRISGEGEPTLHPMISEFIINSVKDCGIDTGLITNGTKLFDISTEALRELSYLGISLDAGDRNTWAAAKQSKPELFDEIIEGIKRCRKDAPDLDITIKYLEYDSNYSLKNIEFGRFIHQESYAGQIEVERELKNSDEVSEARKLSENLGVKFLYKRAYERFAPEYKFEKCRVTPLGGVFGSNLNFHICCDARGRYILTDDYTRNRWTELPELWSSEKHRKLIDSIIPLSCKGCAKKSHNELLQSISLPETNQFRNFI